MGSWRTTERCSQGFAAAPRCTILARPEGDDISPPMEHGESFQSVGNGRRETSFRHNHPKGVANQNLLAVADSTKHMASRYDVVTVRLVGMEGAYRPLDSVLWKTRPT